MQDDLEKRTIAKVSARLIPFLIICYFIAYLDRVNVGFAALTMNKDLGLSASMFGFGSGVFFLAYFLFEVPSNLLLHRFGARRWIARIMVTWGVLSGAMTFIPQIAAATGVSQEWTFYVLRILLGFAEAGFFPGVIFYLTLWYPGLYRARITSAFMAAIPLSSVIGSPLSSQILRLDGAYGLAGWQWLFIIEAIPAVILAAVVLGYLTDRPAQATWLAEDERTWLNARLAVEDRQRESVQQFSVWRAMADPRVLAISIVYFGVVACNYVLSFWLPTMVKSFGVSTTETGWITAIPFVVGTAGMVWYGRRSDARHERKGHMAVALLLAAGGLAACTQTNSLTVTMIFISIAAFGIFAALPLTWTFPTAFLTGAASAAGIAVINSVGNLSGFAGPYAMGFLKDKTGGYGAGLLFSAGLALLSMVVVLLLKHPAELELATEAHGTEPSRL